MGISQIGNGDFPLNNCAILRQVLPETSLDFLKTVLRGEAFANPIADLAGNVKGNIGEAISKIGTLRVGQGSEFFDEFANVLGDENSGFLGQLIDFESRTNRMSGVITGFQEGEPDLGRILGIGSAYNSALATLATNPEDILKDNFSHGFNSLKQEFGVNAIQESNTAIEAAGNFLAQFGLGSTDIPGSGSFVTPNPFDFYAEAQQILGDIRSIQQSITNIITAEDAFLAGALAFLDQYALANTALSGVLADPCMAGKVIKDLAASGDLSSLIPEINIPEPPSLDDILGQIPDPEDIGNAIKESVEGIVESVQEQVEELIDTAAEIGKETVEAIQKSAEELIAAGEAIVEGAEQAAKDLATNVEEFGKDVEEFFEDLEKQVEEATSDEEVTEEEVEAPEALPPEENENYGQVKELFEQSDRSTTGIDLLRGVPTDKLESALASANPNSALAQDIRRVLAERQPPRDERLDFKSTAYRVRDKYVNFAAGGGFSDMGVPIGPYEESFEARKTYLAENFTADELRKTIEYMGLDYPPPGLISREEASTFRQYGLSDSIIAGAIGKINQ